MGNQNSDLAIVYSAVAFLVGYIIGLQIGAHIITQQL
jgi:uncharacterized protein YneF (UPF0154 family)